MTSDSSPVVVNVTDGVALVELNRPDASNAIGLELGAALHAAFLGIGADPDARVVLLAGRGRMFSAGGDVKEMSAHEAGADREAYLRQLTAVAHDAIEALLNLDRPVVAAVHGAAAGAGLALTLAADLVVADAGARFLTAYAGIGVTPDCGVSKLLPAAVGQRRALELALTGRVLTAEEAVAWGIATRTAPAGEALGAARELAAQLAAGPVPALGATRLMLRRNPGRPLRDVLDEESDSISRLSASPASVELMARFVARR